jgi:glycosyltransferase 2 family protein
MTPEPIMGGPPVPGPGPRVAGGMRSRSRRAVRILIQALLTIGVTWAIVSRVGVTLEDAFALDQGVPDFQVGWMALSVAVLLAGFLFAARLWGWMAAELGARDPGTWGSARVVLTANLGRYLPGKVWQVAGLALLSRRAGVPASTGTAAGILVQGFQLAATVVWAVPVLIGARAGEEVGATGPIAAVLLLAVVALTSVPAITRSGIRLLFRLARRDPGGAPRLPASFGARWLGWHLVLWAVYGAAFLMFLRGLGFHPPALEAVAAFAAAYLLGYLAVFAPAGIGVRESVLMALLLPVLGVGAAAVAILARVWMTAAELVPAGVLAGWELLRAPDGSGIDPESTEARAKGRGGGDG